jgi:hypothetical protein
MRAAPLRSPPRIGAAKGAARCGAPPGSQGAETPACGAARQTPGPPPDYVRLRQNGVLRTSPAAHGGGPLTPLSPPSGRRGLRPGTCRRGPAPFRTPACPLLLQANAAGSHRKAEGRCAPRASAPLQRRHPSALRRLPARAAPAYCTGAGDHPIIPTRDRRNAGNHTGTHVAIRRGGQGRRAGERRCPTASARRCLVAGSPVPRRPPATAALRRGRCAGGGAARRHRRGTPDGTSLARLRRRTG